MANPYWVLGHLPDQGPSPPIAQFGRAASSRKSLVRSKLLPFKNDGGDCVLRVVVPVWGPERSGADFHQ